MRRVSIGANNTAGVSFGKMETKTFYSLENQTNFDFEKQIRNGCFVFIDGFAANPNFTVNGSILTFEEGFMEGTEIIIIAIV